MSQTVRYAIDFELYPNRFGCTCVLRYRRKQILMSFSKTPEHHGILALDCRDRVEIFDDRDRWPIDARG